MGVEHVPEFLPHLQQRVAWSTVGIKLSQPILHNSADKASRMRHEHREVLGIARARFLPSRVAEPLDKPQERCGIMLGNRTVGARVVPVRPKCVLRNNDRAAELFGAIKHAKLRKVAGSPGRQFTEPLELAFILTAPARRIRWLRGRFKFNKRTWRRALPDKRYVGSPNAGVVVFRRNAQSLPNG